MPDVSHGELCLLDLASGKVPAIPPACGEALAQAAGVCLDEHGHRQGVTMRVTGQMQGTFELKWPEVTDAMRRFFADLDMRVEQGTYAVAISLMLAATSYTVIRRSMRGNGFDYHLGETDSVLFQDSARLEVSGIRSGDGAQVAARMRRKLQQTVKAGDALPVYVVVVEFSAPRSQVQSR